MDEAYDETDMEDLLNSLSAEDMVSEGGPIGPTDDDGQTEEPKEEEE